MHFLNEEKTKMTRWKEPTNPLKHALKIFLQPVRLLSNMPKYQITGWNMQQ